MPTKSEVTAYLKKHDVEAKLADALNGAIAAGADNPLASIGQQLLSTAAVPSSKPTLNYFAICGRGEVARLIAAAGEVDFENKLWDPAFDETGGWRQGYAAIGQAYGYPGVLPILEHGDLKLFQTTAIESYLASLSPKFATLSVAEKAKDMMFQLIKSDINGSTESLLFKKIGPEDLVPVMKKWYGTIEGMLPEAGFVNGKAFPTPADLSVLVIAKGCMPFQAAPTIAGCAPTADEYPKMFRVAEAAAAYGKVADFLATAPTSYKASTLKADPFGIMPASYHASSTGPFAFASGLPDCCTASPDLYKTIAEIPGVARLVEMTFPPGAKDLPHEHPVHNMYFLVDCKLKISGPPTPTKLGEEGGVAEVPAGAAPIFPAMAHQVENVGDCDGRAVFVEAFPGCKPCGDIEGYISPFEVSPGCYKILEQDDNWITGMLTMEVGEKDDFHHHRDHLIYVLQGDGVTIYPGGDEAAAMVVPLKVGAGIPAPMAAPPFASHTLLNSGTVPLKMLFFEAKK